MERQNYILKIDNPCRQDWTAMSQNENGKFCSHCSKTVVDFTTLTNSEVIQLIEQTSGKLCGRLTNQQLNRFLATNQPSSYSRLYKILAGLMLVGTTENALATDRPTLQTEIFSIADNEELTTRHFEKNEKRLTDSLKNIVFGKAFDAHTKEPLSFASIFIKDSKTGVMTDFDGNFKLIIPDNLLTEKIVLVVTYIGYEKTEITIDKKDLPITIELLVIPPENVLVGEICIIKKKKWWQFWK